MDVKNKRYLVKTETDSEPTYIETETKNFKSDGIYIVIGTGIVWIWMGKKTNKKAFHIAHKMAKKIQKDLDISKYKIQKASDGKEPQNYPKL